MSLARLCCLGWEAPSSIIATGLTYREAIYCIIFGSMIDTIPLVLNGEFLEAVVVFADRVFQV